MTVEVDREKAAVYGITIDQVRQELFNAFGARQVATIYTPTNDYQVILESQPRFQADPSQLQNIFVKTNVTGGGGTGTGPGAGVNGNGIPSGNAIPLSAVTRSTLRPAIRSGRRSMPSRRSSANFVCRSRSAPASKARRRCSRIRSKAKAC
jgi:Cu/Ag efflux pump CusA